MLCTVRVRAQLDYLVYRGATRMAKCITAAVA